MTWQRQGGLETTLKNSRSTLQVEHAVPKTGAPNVVLIVLDDLGFAQLGCYGSPIATPHIDALAKHGLRYNRFHVTAACASSRACFMTGRNSHSVGMGFLPEAPLEFPGYTGTIPRSAGTLARVLRDAGYSTFAVGKWHLTPRYETGPTGPFDRWPLGMGFERYYGFSGAMTNQWTPTLIRDNSYIDPPHTFDPEYHLTEELIDESISFLMDREHSVPDKPFFLYLALGAVHEPHHAPQPWIERYRGQFDAGWDAYRSETSERQKEFGVVPDDCDISPRPPWVEDWTALSDDERKIFAAQMEAFAGFLSHADHHLGRLFEYLENTGGRENTAILVVSDNGASAEGGPKGSFSRLGVDSTAEMVDRVSELGGHSASNHYSWGWAWAGNTPFKLWKRYSWLGGVRVPFVVLWPAGLACLGVGQVRTQFAHAVDLMPTILDIAGVHLPGSIDGVPQSPLDGASLLPTFDCPEFPSPRSTQYFELMGSRSIYHDGWKATTNHLDSSILAERELMEGSHEFTDDKWQLFHLDEDFAESVDLAEQYPERLNELVGWWWHEAGANRVLPLSDGFADRYRSLAPSPHTPRRRYVYHPGGRAIQTPPMFSHGFRALMRVDSPEATGPRGVVCSQGDRHLGWSCYFVEGRLAVAFSFGAEVHKFCVEEKSGPGDHLISVHLARRAVSVYQLGIAMNGESLVEASFRAELSLPAQHGVLGRLLLGRDSPITVSDDYDAPFGFSGTVREVVLEVDDGPPVGFNDVAVQAMRED